MTNPIVRFFSDLFGARKAWWVEIQTNSPRCVYYFGPFDAESEAVAAQVGYVEDLEKEGAQQIRVSVQYSSTPQQLTVEEPGESFVGFKAAALSS